VTTPATAPASRGTATYAPAAAAVARAAQLAVRASLLRDVARLWPLLDKANLPGSFPGWVAAMSALINRYHAQSATASAAFYRAAREAATGSPTPDSLVRLAKAPDSEWVSRALGFAGPGMLSRDTARPNTALSTTLGTAARIALDGGRSTLAATVEADPAALGWYRVTDGDPCAFCALVASRGIVYKDEGTAGRDANSQFTGSGLFKYHNDCGCIAAAAFARDQELPALSAKAAEVYKSRGSGDALVAFRKAWNDHQKPRQAA
jgi:hypothetical protein